MEKFGYSTDGLYTEIVYNIGVRRAREAKAPGTERK